MYVLHRAVIALVTGIRIIEMVIMGTRIGIKQKAAFLLLLRIQTTLLLLLLEKQKPLWRARKMSLGRFEMRKLKVEMKLNW
jgi:hypothetical protein